MTRDETKQIVFLVSKTFPNFLKTDDAKEISATVNAWYLFLEEYNYNDIALALKAYVATSGSAFAPSVSQLIEMLSKPQEMAQMSEGEAWAIVHNAICNSAYNSEAEFKALPSEIQKAVGSASQLHAWAIDSDFNATVVMSNFQRAYKTVVQRQKEYNRLPIAMQEQAQKFAELRDKTINQMLIEG